MSMRNSLLVWVFGAVLGWVVAVVAIYSAIRIDEPMIADDQKTRPDNASDFDRIEPATGESR